MCTANFSKEKSNKQEIIFSKVSEREKIYSFTTAIGAPVAMASVVSIKKKSENNKKERKKPKNCFIGQE